MSFFRRRKAGRLSGSLTGGADAGVKSNFVSRWQRLAVMLTFVVLVASLTNRVQVTTDVVESEVNFDAIAQETVKAEFAFKAELLDKTESERKLAEGQVPGQYKIDPVQVDVVVATYDELVSHIALARDRVARDLAAAAGGMESQEAFNTRALEIVSSAAAGLRADVASFESLADDTPLTRWLTPNVDALTQLLAATDVEEESSAAPPVDTFAQFRRLEAAGRAGVAHAARFGVLEADENVPAAANETAPGYVISRNDAPSPELRDRETLPFDGAPTRDAARDRLLKRIGEDFETDATAGDEAAANAARDNQNAAFAVAELVLAPTLFFDEAETAFERAQARQQVEPIERDFRRGETIQQDGLPWSAQSISDYETMLRIQQGGDESATGVFSDVIANMLFAGLALMCLLRSLRIVTPKGEESDVHLNVALLILGATMVVGRVAMTFEPSGYIVPVMAGAILLAILTNVGLAATYSFLASALLSIQFGYTWSLFAVHCAMCLGGAMSIVQVRRRRDMSSAALKATVIGLAASAAADVASGSLLAERSLWLSEEASRHLLLVGLNGAVCLFLIPGLLSPLERLFRITTDIQLLEYSDLNNEVLSRLAMEIPATYAHSLMLGQLAEAASDAIGANGLKARVCAYYHDIGKLRRPEYFYENQTGQNVHEGMPPRLSARAIASHVSEGAEMAREFHLPKPFIDAILEHHGTGLISFFYTQAIEEQKHGGVREEDFRYPGPKPQSRETAILMICDASESAVRTLKNPNEERVRELVTKLVRARLDDRQFDECDITMRDLDAVIGVVSARLSATMHQRLAYPGQPGSGDGQSGNIVRMSGTSE
jgi:putative nucleotidyltransferase with HDIG domain